MRLDEVGPGLDQAGDQTRCVPGSGQAKVGPGGRCPTSFRACLSAFGRFLDWLSAMAHSRIT